MLVEVEDDGLDEDAPPIVVVCAANLPRIQGAPTKRHRLFGDMCSTLDYFAKLQVCIVKMKMKSAIQLHQDNKKTRLDILCLQQASIECVSQILQMLFGLQW